MIIVIVLLFLSNAMNLLKCLCIFQSGIILSHLPIPVFSTFCYMLSYA